MARNRLNTLKLKASGNYYQREEKYNWGFEINRQQDIYNADYFELTYNIFHVSGILDVCLIESYPLLLNTGYAVQNISNDLGREIKLFFLDLKIQKEIFEYFKIAPGFFRKILRKK